MIYYIWTSRPIFYRPICVLWTSYANTTVLWTLNLTLSITPLFLRTARQMISTPRLHPRSAPNSPCPIRKQHSPELHRTHDHSTASDPLSGAVWSLRHPEPPDSLVLGTQRNLANGHSNTPKHGRKPTPRRHSMSSSLALSTTIGGLSPVIEEQLLRQKSETFEVVDGDNTKFTFSIISEISTPDAGCLEGRNSVGPAIKKTCETIAKCIR